MLSTGSEVHGQNEFAHATQTLVVGQALPSKCS